jgi:hypothetical protein
LAIPLFAGEKAPLPAKLLNAKTALLVNESISPKVYDALYDQLKKWNHFQIVESKERADIVIVFSSHIVLGGLQSYYYLRIADPKDDKPDTALWSDSCGEGISISYPARKMVSTLRKRMDKK